MDIQKVFELSENKELSKETIEERAANAMNFWNNQFKEQLQKMIFTQYENIGKTELSFDFIKGTLNGLGLIEDWFVGQITIAKNNNDDE